MRTVKSYFSGTIFFRNLKRYWPIWSLYTLALGIFVVVTLLPIFSYGRSHYYDSTAYYSMRELLLEEGLIAGRIMNLVFGAVSALAVFSFLYDFKQTQMIHNLPTKREGQFFAAFASGLTWLIGANLIAFLLALVMELSAGYFEISWLLAFFGTLCANSICFFGIATLCALLVGNKGGMLLLYGIVNFGAIVVEALAAWATSFFVFGAAGLWDEPVLAPLSPIVQLFYVYDNLYESGRFLPERMIPWLLIYAVAGLLLAALALLLYRRRHLESASELIAVKPLRPIFRYAMAFLASSLLCIFLLGLVFEYEYLGTFMPFLLCLLAGGFIGYFGIEMLIRKTTRVFKKSWKGFCVYAGVMLALMLALQFDVFGIERYRPEPDQITTITVGIGYYERERTTFADPESIRVLRDWHGDVIAGKKRLKGDNYGDLITLTYDLNGRTVTRKYYLGSISDMIQEPLLSEMLDILDAPDAILQRHTFQREYTERNAQENYIIFPYGDNYPSEFNLTSAEAVRLYYEGILPDMQSGRIGTILSEFYPYRAYDASGNECHITLYLSEIVQGKEHREYVSLNLQPDSVNTMAVLKDLGILP
ncbi:MAG: hypothetical protein FWF10_06505 [Clostridiales bacterium]|nr:hypothetical protein [Clostridiales bacterium]